MGEQLARQEAGAQLVSVFLLVKAVVSPVVAAADVAVVALVQQEVLFVAKQSDLVTEQVGGRTCLPEAESVGPRRPALVGSADTIVD